MNKQKLEEMATTAFENMTKARAALFTAAEVSIMEKYLLEEQRAAAMVGGVIKGTNDKMRDAEMKEHLQPQYLKLAAAENAERKARYDFDRAQTDVDTVKTFLRIAELAE